MNWLRFFRRVRRDSEVARDLEFYLAEEIEDNAARGMTPEMACAAARRKLGNTSYIREDVYRMNTVGFLETTWQDVRYALRALRQYPAFALTAMLTLALGIGGNTAVFTVIHAVLLKPLEYRDPDRLVKIAEFDPGTPNPVTVDFTTTYDWRARSRSFEHLSLYRDAAGAIVERGQPELIQGMRVNYDYFDTLGARMQLGRAFLPEEDRPDRRFEVILTHDQWTQRYGGDPGVVGRVIHLNDAPFTVVGVLPPTFRPLARSEGSILPVMYLPLGYALGGPSSCRGCQHLQLIGRLKPGVSADQAQGELNSIMRDIVREHPADYNRAAGVSVAPLREFLVGKVSTAMWVLLGAVGFVLLIACANVANLVLARASGRAKEIAVRAALGAGRARLVRQLISESLVIGIGGGAAGLLVAWRGVAALSALGARQLPRAGEVHIDAAVLWFTVAASLATVVLFGVLPAVKATRTDLTDALKDTGRSTGGHSRNGLRDLLVGAEMALAFVLVMGAGLLGKSFLNLMHVSPGYDTHHVLTLSTYVYGPRYRSDEGQLNYYQQAMDRVRAIPGIESVGMVSTLPLASFDRRGFHIQDRHLATTADAPSADSYSVSPDYFHAMRIPLKRGRFFTEQDRKGTPGVALISENCARTQFANQDAIGKHIQLGGRSEEKEWLTIVGIVGDVRQYALDRAPGMEAYIAQAQNLNFGYSLVARTNGDPTRLENAVRSAFLSVDQTQPVFKVQPLESYLADTLATRTFTLVLLGLFGVLAMSLAAVGVYGVISYSVALRTREVGIRMALGAERADVLGMVLLHGLKLTSVGLVAGVCVSLAVTRYLGTLLYEVRPMDLATSVVVAIALGAVALLASYLPARRATRIDPMSALRA
jgi:predicted permease